MNQEQKARRLLADIGLNHQHLTSAEFKSALEQEFPNDLWTSQYTVYILRTSGLHFVDGQYSFKPETTINTADQEKATLKHLTAKDAYDIGISLYLHENADQPVIAPKGWWIKRCIGLGFNGQLPDEDSGWGFTKNGNLIWCPPNWWYSKNADKYYEIPKISPQYARNIIKKYFNDVKIADLLTDEDKSYRTVKLEFLTCRALGC